MLKGILYEVEIEYDTNAGEYSTRRIFDNKKEAEEFIDAWTEGDDSVEEREINEWDGYGPNWKTLKILTTDSEVITLAEIDNRDDKKDLEE